MAFPYEFQLAHRNLSRHPFHTAGMVGGLALAVLVMTYIPSTMASFYDDIKDKAIEQNSAHVTVWPRERPAGVMDRALRGEYGAQAILALEDRTFPRHRDLNGHRAVAAETENTAGVVAVAPFIKGDATVQHGKVTMSIAVEGIQPVQYSRVVNIAKHFPDRVLPKLGPMDVAIGFRMAEKLSVHVGESIRISTPTTTRRMKVRAIYHSGYYQKDLYHAYVSIEDAQNMFSMGNEVSGLAVRTEELNAAAPVSADLKRSLGLKIRNWMDDNASLLQEFETVRLVTLIINVLVAVTASVGIANVFSMFVLSRQKELAILRAIGSSKLSLRAVLMMEALFIWVAGTLIGFSLSLGVMAYETAYPFFQVSAETYGIGVYSTKPKVEPFIWAGTLSLAAMVFSALRSGSRAAKLSPVKVIFGN